MAVLVIAGCGTGAQKDAAEGAGQGYVAGDGSFTTWAPDERGQPIEMSGTSYVGEEIDLALWRGDVVVLNFWYAACPPCRAEAPDLRDISQDYQDQGVRMLGVNPRDGAGTAQAFERTFEVPYPSLHDNDARAVATMGGVVHLRAMPSTVVLDRQGRVVARILGQVDPTILRGLIDDTLTEQV